MATLLPAVRWLGIGLCEWVLITDDCVPDSCVAFSDATAEVVAVA